MTRADRYRRQAEIARRSISQWPDWMQRTITPPQEDIPRLVEKPAPRGQSTGSPPSEASGAEPSKTSDAV
jgi:hypothetical protein